MTVTVRWRQCSGNLWETRWSTLYMGFSKHTDTILNWTEQKGSNCNVTLIYTTADPSIHWQQVSISFQPYGAWTHSQNEVLKIFIIMMLTAFTRQMRSKPTKYWSTDLSILAGKLRPKGKCWNGVNNARWAILVPVGSWDTGKFYNRPSRVSVGFIWRHVNWWCITLQLHNCPYPVLPSLHNF